MSGQPYDPRAAAIDAMAAMRWPDVSEPPPAQLDAMAEYLSLRHAMSRVQVLLERHDCMPPISYIVAAAEAGREGRPLVPPK